MASPKQVAANRANAKKSTGPKPESWEKTKMNALRHGLTGQVNLMPDEDREAHDKFCAAIVDSLLPEGPLETQFAQAVAEDNWRMNRGRAIETNIFAIGHFGPGFPGNPESMHFGTASLDINNPEIDAAVTAAQVFAAAPNKFQLLSLYMQRTNRDMQKTLDRLTALQTDRKARRQEDLDELSALLEQNEVDHQPIENTETQGTNGFVFSIHQIRAFAARKRQLKKPQAASYMENNRLNSKQNDRKQPFRHAA
jgi:hypothetical protein